MLVWVQKLGSWRDTPRSGENEQPKSAQRESLAFRLENAGSRGRGAAWEPAKLRPVYWGLEGGARRSCKGGIVAARLSFSALPSVFLWLSCLEASGIKRERPEEFATILNI